MILDWEFSSKNYERLKHSLTNNQKIQLEKYWSIDDQYNYVSTHAIVNIIFSRLNKCEICDADIQFEHGKPYIANSENIKYSISHTKQCAVLAFHANEIGIDIENYSCAFDYHRILQRYFRYECGVFTNIDLRTFYTLWTIKEAYIKFSKKGIKDIENIDVLKQNRKKAVIKDRNTQELFDIDIIDVQKMFVVSICFEK
ncbi:MAG: 4'-phosphopantetheinyl transferase superfamily protein [Fusobacterium necrophorum]|nr:4'-phosphopantetheinyl transferase superfamily protein [Fusobacterium necrophorum]